MSFKHVLYSSWYNVFIRKIYFRCFYNTSSCLRVNVNYTLKKFIRISQKNMNPIGDPNLLSPPEGIRGLMILDKTYFNKKIKIPVIELNDDVVISKVMPHFKKYLLKMENLKPLQIKGPHDKHLLLNPVFVTQWLDIHENDRNNLELLLITEKNFKHIDFTLSYDNWRADELLKYILPEDNTSVAGFSKIGHIIHLNLRDHVMDYKEIIGQILLDKTPGCRTVVNKVDKIDNTYRNFEMEILCGDTNMFVQVKENHCTFEFDFLTVYWNPRLATEHERIVNMLKPGDVLYDVFAGVGPFSIPAAKKKCVVFANDLNPESYKWLKHNAEINKIKDGFLHTFNKDGEDFIKNELKEDLKICLSKQDNTNIYITMNLPALATEFLKVFSGILQGSGIEDKDIVNYPIVHVYCFAKGEDSVQLARDLVENGLGHKLTDNLIEIFNVRKVSSYKEMMRVTFKLTKDILVGPVGTKRKTSEDDLQNGTKKLCHGEEQRETEGEKCIQSSGCEKLENQN